MMELLLRFYDPISGKIVMSAAFTAHHYFSLLPIVFHFQFLDDADLRDIRPESLRSQIGIVSQEPALFDYSVAENIAYGMDTDEINLMAVIEAAKLVDIHDFIMSLPDVSLLH